MKEHVSQTPEHGRHLQRDIPLIKGGYLEQVITARWMQPTRADAADSIMCDHTYFNKCLRRVNFALGTQTIEQSVIAAMDQGILPQPEKPEDAKTLFLTSHRYRVVTDFLRTGDPVEDIAKRHSMDPDKVRLTLVAAGNLVGIGSRDLRFDLFRWGHYNHVKESAHKRSFVHDPSKTTERSERTVLPADETVFSDKDISLLDEAIRFSRKKIAAEHGHTEQTIRQKIKEARRRLRSAELDTTGIDPADLIARFKAGDTIEQVASALNTSSAVIARAIIDHDLSRQSIEALNKPQQPERVKVERAKKKQERTPPTRRNDASTVTLFHASESPPADDIAPHQSEPYRELKPSAPILPPVIEIQFDEPLLDEVERKLTETELELFDRIANECTAYEQTEAIKRVVRNYGYPLTAPERLIRKIRALTVTTR